MLLDTNTRSRRDKPRERKLVTCR